MKNPFVGWGKCVDDESRFVGRAKQIKKIVRDLEAGANFSISGLRRIGKTSLAKLVIKKIKQSTDIRDVEIDMSTIKSENEFYKKIIVTLWKEKKDDFHFDTNPHDLYLQIIQCFERDYLQKKQKTIVLLDELDNIRYIDNSNIIVNRIRELANNSKCGVTFLFVSARSLKCLQDNTGNVSNLHGICTSLYLKPLDKEVGLRSMLKRAEIDDDDVLTKLFEITGGHPFLSEVVLYHALDIAEEKEIKCDALVLQHSIETDECALCFQNYYENLKEFLRSWDHNIASGIRTNAFEEYLDICVGPILTEPNPSLNNVFKSYGLITDENRCMSEHLFIYLSYLRREKPIEPLINDLERNLRDVIKKKFIEKKGENWVNELCEDDWFKKLFAELKEMMDREQRLWKLGSTNDILEYSYPGTLKEIICYKWEWFQHFVGNSKSQFSDWMDAIAKIRNSVKHNRPPKLVPRSDYEKAKRVCEELLKKLRESNS